MVSNNDQQDRHTHIEEKHSHSHGHHHHRHHHHHSESNLALAFFLNISFAIVEIIGGIYTNSVAIVSDAIHDLGDSFAIGFAWYLEKKSNSHSDQVFSYGYRRLSSLSAIITGIVLMLGSVIVLAKSIPRIFNPEQPNINGMIGLALLGVVVNGYAAFKVSGDKSLNTKMISLHLLEDVLGWLIVLIAAVIMKFWHLPQVDAILATLLAIWVLYNVFKGFKSSLNIFLQMTPGNLDLNKITEMLISFRGVKSLHHLHTWSLDGEKHILTVHLMVASNNVEDWANLKRDIKKQLNDKFSIYEATLELEYESEKCYDPHHFNG